MVDENTRLVEKQTRTYRKELPLIKFILIIVIMKSNNRNIISLLAIVLAVVFSSCVKDPFDEKRNASLNIHPAKQKTSSNGIFSVRKEISKKDISNVDHDWDWEKVIDIWLRNSEFKIASQNLESSYFIKLDISCSYVTEGYSKKIAVQNFNNTSSGININISQDAEYASFMEKVFKELKTRKSLDFNIQGIVIDESESPVSNVELTITVDNQLEVKVRQYGID